MCHTVGKREPLLVLVCAKMWDEVWRSHGTNTKSRKFMSGDLISQEMKIS